MKIKRGIQNTLGVLLCLGLLFSACENVSEPKIETSLDRIPNLKAISSAQDVSMTVTRGDNSYFKVELNNIQPNHIINNGVSEAWCIVYDKPINSDNGNYEGLQLYSTFGSNQFKPVNHFLNERHDLRRQFPDMTWREEQVIIWSLIDYKDFNINSMDLSELGSSFQRDGQPRFDTELVQSALNSLNETVHTFEYSSGQEFAIAVDNGVEEQTTIVVGNTMFAFGSYEGSFICQQEMNRWGWYNEFDSNSGEFLYEGNEAPLNQTPFIAGAGGGGEVCEPYPNYQHSGLKVGDLTVNYEDGHFYFTFSADDNYAFSDPHFWVGCSGEELESLGGNPPANFDGLNEVTGHNVMDSQDLFTNETFIYDVSNISCDGNYFISVHAGND